MFTIVYTVHMATSPAIRRSNQREELRSIILDAAREMFVEEGFEAFSMRKLAARVGYSPASIYQHFASKDALFQTLVQGSFQALVEVQAQAAANVDAPGPVAALKRGMHSYVRFGLDHPNEYRLAFLMPASGKRSASAEAAFDSLRRRVEACIAAGLFRAIDAELAAQSLWVAVHGVTSLLIVKPSFPWVEKDRLIEQVIHNAVQGMVVPEI
jgi:AcrR family transcriptional regulator